MGTPFEAKEMTEYIEMKRGSAVDPRSTAKSKPENKGPLTEKLHIMPMQLLLAARIPTSKRRSDKNVTTRA